MGSIGRIGQNTYSVTSGTLSGRSNGDTYQCTAATNLFSPDLNDSTVLRGIYMHIMCICVRAQNVKYYIVDGETIHYCLFPTLSPSFLSLSPVASDPTIVSLSQVSATTVRVEWSQPSGGASVTGYTIHYSDGSSDSFMSVGASSTSACITGLTDGHTYSISVEATSEQLSGESATRDITLCEFYGYIFYRGAMPQLHM